MKNLGLFFLLFFASKIAAQTIWRVRADASPASPNGLSWATAFPDLQLALAAAQGGDEIWLAAGTYRPTADGDRLRTFTVPSGVALFGGFSGTETAREQRDFAQNLSILSGDIGALGDSTDNAFGVIYLRTPNGATRLDGLVIEEGNANNPDINVLSHRRTRSGGGVCVDGEAGFAYMSIANCTFRRNRAAYQGGAITVIGRDNGKAMVRLENCLFERNYAKAYGGAVSIENFSGQFYPLEIRDCIFRGNYAVADGGAIRAEARARTTIERCVFERNTIKSGWGGAVFFYGSNNGFPIDWSSCQFLHNGGYNAEGGAVAILVYEQSVELSVRFTDCVFWGQRLGTDGTTVFSTFYLDAIHTNFSNCIFGKNNSKYSHPLVRSGLRGVDFQNCLFFENSKYEFAQAKVSLTNCIRFNSGSQKMLPYYSSSIHLSHCLLNAPSCDSLGMGIDCGAGNIFNVDPMFADTALGDFRLLPCSPAINAGDDALLDSLGIATDLDGQPRRRHGRVDIGPYEAWLRLSADSLRSVSCAGGSDGAAFFSGNFCPPLTAWLDGQPLPPQALAVENLPAGSHVLAVADAHGVADTLVFSLPEPPALAAGIAASQAIACAGGSDGSLTANATGGTPPYQFSWENGANTAQNDSIPAGNYGLTVTDANGCSANTLALLGEPPRITVHLGIQNATDTMPFNGAISVDSIGGGTPPFAFLWEDGSTGPARTNLAPGAYLLWLTDAAGCTEALTIWVGLMLGTDALGGHDFRAEIWPNPTPAGSAARLKILGASIFWVEIFGLQGRLLERTAPSAASEIWLPAHFPAGVYVAKISTKNGQTACLSWNVAGD